jgi:hydrogenase maturation protein HypF
LAEQTHNSATIEKSPRGLAEEESPDLAARRLILAGGVQGLGVRPSIYRLANELDLNGTVRNSPRGVEIEVEGPRAQVALFEYRLPNVLPVEACVSHIASAIASPAGRASFAIVNESTQGPLVTRVPADRAVCSECLREISEPGDRRRDYPFTSCTLCGPRYTVIRAMPFERGDTAMDNFPLCEDCRREFRRPRDRRFHAQTIACPRCGPAIRSRIAGRKSELHGVEAVKEAVRYLAAGKIVALRGLGGYQLLVDATNETAVERLRERKGRRAKPLAVMVKSTDVAERLADLNETELACLANSTGAIVLARARSNNCLATAVKPYLDTIGLMLPTTPLHALVAESFGSPLVCTSANGEGNPLQYEEEAANQQLAAVCDVLIHHNREIVRPIDDSVVRYIANRPVMMRLARGMAPLSLELPAMSPTISLGGFLKAAAAWSNGNQAVLGPHIGDQQSLASRERFVAHLADMQQLYRFRPELLVHDMHPEYFSTQWAQAQGIPTLAVQHHHAHVAAGMLEHGWLDRTVLGVAWDGTGYGTDGTIWGGEFLVCTSSGFKRVARMRPFSLPGGEAAIREPWRIAVSICSQLKTHVDVSKWPGWKVSPEIVESVTQIVDRPQLSPATSSAGRLMDAAAALILGIDRADFDGQAAMRLEAAADRTASSCYPFPPSDERLAELDWRPLFVLMLDDQRRGTDPRKIAMRFHRSLAQGIVLICRRWNALPIVLSGGVFQNKLLTELIVEMMDGDSQPLGLPGIIPPNDGGLAAGQLAIAAAKGKS